MIIQSPPVTKKPAQKMISVFSPSVIFLTTLIAFTLLPGLYLYWFEIHEGLYLYIPFQAYQDATLLYLCGIGVFLSVFILSRYVVFSGDAQARYVYSGSEEVVSPFSRLVDPVSRLNRLIAVAGVLSVGIYFLVGGHEKLLSLGSDMGAAEYRFIGYDDRARFLVVALEISRRVLLPISVLFFLTVRRIGVKINLLILGILLCSQLLGAVVTLDRAPVLLFFLMVLYPGFCTGKGWLSLLRAGAVMLAAIIVVAGITTFLQYNITQFSFTEAVETGVAFFLHRTIVVPSVAAVELSFNLFPADAEKLHLAYSRLMALFGQELVGSHSDLSVYVTPVGAIADIWRNFGYSGLIMVAMFLGWFLKKIDTFTFKASPIVWIVSSFNIFSLCFYWIFGIFFSQGVFFQMLFTYFYCRYAARIEARGVERRRAVSTAVV